jgi:hypothetical protein
VLMPFLTLKPLKILPCRCWQWCSNEACGQHGHGWEGIHPLSVI